MASPCNGIKILLDEHSTVNKEDVLTIISNCFVENFKIDKNKAVLIVKKILEEQQNLKKRECHSFKASETIPFELVITQERIHCLRKQIGQGTYSFVFESLIIPTVRHEQENVHFSPGKPLSAALKKTKASGLSTAFTPEKKKLMKRLTVSS